MIMLATGSFTMRSFQRFRAQRGPTRTRWPYVYLRRVVYSATLPLVGRWADRFGNASSFDHGRVHLLMILVLTNLPASGLRQY